MISYIQAKQIISTFKLDENNFFGIKYNMNLYRGCQHGCIYCDTRSNCYQIGNLADIRIKENALDLLNKELKSKRIKGTVGTGSMNDPYMPVERKYEITRNALKIINKYNFPVHIITKSNLVSRDSDILQEISKTYAAVSFTITTFDDVLAKKLEPYAPASSKRFEALKELSNKGIYCGITLMPILPFINDDWENIRNITLKAKECGAQYILAWFGLTQREGQREYFHNKLDEHFPNMRAKYINAFGDNYSCNSPNSKKLWQSFQQLCNELQIDLKMKFYKPVKDIQESLF